MTIQRTLFAALLTAFAAAPNLASQGISADSLARLRLPADPKEMPRVVATGEMAVTYLFDAGCPSDGGWAGAAFAALEKEAGTDARVQRLLAGALGFELANAVRFTVQGPDYYGEPRCPSELPRYEAWLAEQLRREWEAGLLRSGQQGRGQMAGSLIAVLAAAKAPETYLLVLDIAGDSTVFGLWRSQAAETLVYINFGEGDTGWRYVWDESPEAAERYLEAHQRVLFDLAAGAPLEYEGELRQIVRSLSELGPEGFDRKYEEVLKAAGRERFQR